MEFPRNFCVSRKSNSLEEQGANFRHVTDFVIFPREFSGQSGREKQANGIFGPKKLLFSMGFPRTKLNLFRVA